MRTSGRWRRRMMWLSGCAVLGLGTLWLFSARWLIWYAWDADILTPLDVRLVGLGEGGVFYKAFHPHSRSDFLLEGAGWHVVPTAWHWSLSLPALSTRQYRTDFWLPLWPLTAAAVLLLALVWLWPVRRRAGWCACGYSLTGTVGGRCPECEETTACSDHRPRSREARR